MIADKKIRQDWIKNKNMKAFNFYKSEKSYEEVDILIDSPVSFKDAVKKALTVRIKGLNLVIVSPQDFMKMKLSSGRDKDLQDIKNLKMIRGKE